MSDHTADNRTWLIVEGAAVIAKRSSPEHAALSDIERLIHLVWVADYSMTNAGDLLTATDMYPSFQRDAADLAKRLRLPLTHAAFSQPMDVFQTRYPDLFDGYCDEIRASGLYASAQD